MFCNFFDVFDFLFFIQIFTLALKNSHPVATNKKQTIFLYFLCLPSPKKMYNKEHDQKVCCSLVQRLTNVANPFVRQLFRRKNLWIAIYELYFSGLAPTSRSSLICLASAELHSSKHRQHIAKKYCKYKLKNRRKNMGRIGDKTLYRQLAYFLIQYLFSLENCKQTKE